VTDAPEARDLVLAGALISITLNPFLFSGIPAIERWLRARPRLLGCSERRSLRASPETGSVASAMRNHAILIGHGRVGGPSRQCRAGGTAVLVVERDRQRFAALQAQGVRRFRCASVPGVLEQAGVATAAC